MITPQRAQGVIRDLERLRNDLLVAREEEEREPATWSGRSWRWLQRLRGVRTLYGLILAPEHDHVGMALYQATDDLYRLWEAYNEAAAVGSSDGIAARRISFEGSLALARGLLVDAGPPSQGPAGS